MKLTITKKEGSNYKIKFDAKKSADGNLMIYDHPDFDVVLVPSKNKVIGFSKEAMTEEVYDSLNRLFTFLRKEGAVKYDSIQGGNVYGAMEATYASESNWTEPLQFVLYTISNFFDKDIPKQEFVDNIIQREKDDVTNPSVDDTTELGEVPHSKEKGNLRTHYNTWGNIVPFRSF